jgi:hypothetical protein
MDESDLGCCGSRGRKRGGSRRLIKRTEGFYYSMHVQDLVWTCGLSVWMGMWMWMQKSVKLLEQEESFKLR